MSYRFLASLCICKFPACSFTLAQCRYTGIRTASNCNLGYFRNVANPCGDASFPADYVRQQSCSYGTSAVLLTIVHHPDLRLRRYDHGLCSAVDSLVDLLFECRRQLHVISREPVWLRDLFAWQRIAKLPTARRHLETGARAHSPISLQEQPPVSPTRYPDTTLSR
ncbi:hypothetical protein BKA66DRAFT_251552 [Pyrenochaeta sp. MPI-SDFR-AT-0127]|nr:hypothetical protein BKA66DRAFT_251552 [Pyrenochaeta sp. MPI-SDFR-AT-0127]